MMRRTLSVRCEAGASNLNMNRRPVLISIGGALVAPYAAFAEAPPAQKPPPTTSSTLPFVPTRPVYYNSDGSPSSFVTSAVIKGNWQLSGGHKGDKETDRTSGKESLDDLTAFADAGINTWDTADIYGPSERIIGQWMKAHPDSRKAVDASGRPSVQVFTKYCMFSTDQLRQKPADIEARVDASRDRLDLPTLDMVQLYWNDYEVKNYVDAALGLADLQAKGKIRHLGTTNFDVDRLEEMASAGVRFDAHQVQYSLLDRRVEKYYVPYCREKNMGLICYGTVAGGFLSDKYLGVDPSQVKLDTFSKRKYSSIIGQAGGWEWFQELLTVLKRVSDKHQQPIASIATRWVLDRPCVAAAIVGARNANHVDDHRRLFEPNFKLDADDLGAIEEVLAKGKASEGDFYAWERGGKW